MASGRVSGPFVDHAIRRGDDAVWATRHADKGPLRSDGSTSDSCKECECLVARRYAYGHSAGRMCFGGFR